MNRDEAAYCISKQLPTMREIVTDYGNIELTEEMKTAISEALRPLLTKEETER